MDDNSECHRDNNKMSETEKSELTFRQSVCYICCLCDDDALFVPCMHGGICVSCGGTIFKSWEGKRIPQCPLCRKSVRALGQLEIPSSILSLNDHEMCVSLDGNQTTGNYSSSTDNRQNVDRESNKMWDIQSSYRLLRIVLAIWRLG